MADIKYTGASGIIYAGAQALACIRSFSFEETQETVDATCMNTSGVTFRTNLATFQSWSGTIECYWMTDDGVNKTEALGLLQPGPTEITIHFWPAGDAAAGELGYTANCLVTGRTISSSVDGMVEASITVLGTSAITTENSV